MIPIRERLRAAWWWLWLRLTGSRCYAQGCGRLLLAHTPRQLDRCLDTPLGIVLTDRGWLHAQGLDPDAAPPVHVA